MAVAAFRFGRACGAASTECNKYLLQRAEQDVDAFGIRIHPHQPDSPRLAFERPEAARDLDAAIEQRAAHPGIVHAVGNADDVELRQTVRGRREQLQSQACEAARELLVRLAVAGPAGLESRSEERRVGKE